jgi:hypothetical protein
MNSPSRTTLIRGGTIVAWQDGGHRILEDGVVVYRGDSIVHVGRAWSGVADEVVEACGKLVCPGFISTQRMSPTMSATVSSSTPGDGISCVRDFSITHPAAGPTGRASPRPAIPKPRCAMASRA